MGLDVAVDPLGVRSAVTVEVTGGLTDGNASAVVDVLDRAVSAVLALSVLVVDLRGVTLLTVSGVRALSSVADRCAARGVRCCVVARPASPVASVLESAGVAAVLPSFPDVEQALTGAGVPNGSPQDVVVAEELSEQFEKLTRALLGVSTVGAALQHVVDATRIAVPAAAVVSVTLRAPDGEVFTPVETDGAAAELDRVQYRTGRGPCLDAADPSGPAYAASHDLASEPRWPEFAAAAVAAGYGAVHSTEVLAGIGPGRSTGALNIYFHDNHALDHTDRHTALLLATHAALALAHARSTELADLHDVSLRHAIDTRDVIGQAKGILMHRQGITADQAFALLRHTSQELNVKLVEIARTVVVRHSELDW